MTDEHELLTAWIEKNEEDWYSIREVAIGKHEHKRYIDLLLIEDVPFASEEELLRAAGKKKSGYIFNHNKHRFRNQSEKVRFILEESQKDELKFRIYEAKQELKTKALGQILLYKSQIGETFSTNTEIIIDDYGIIYGADDPTIRGAAQEYGVSLEFICPECKWSGTTDLMVELTNKLYCPKCTDSVDDMASQIRNLAQEYHDNYNIAGKCIRFRAAGLEYFGVEPSPDDPIGYVDGTTNRNLSASIAIVKGEDLSAAKEYRSVFSGDKAAMISKLEQTFQELGIDREDDSMSPFSSQKIGPTMPWVLAVLDLIHEIDIDAALKKHGQGIDKANDMDPSTPGSYNWQ